MNWYTKWQSNTNANITHWSIFLIFVCFLSYNLTSRIVSAQSAPDQASAASHASQPIAGSYIITFTDDVSNIPGLAKQVADQSGGTLKFTYTKAIKGMALSNLPDQAVEGLKHNPHIKMVEQDGVVSVAGAQNLASTTIWNLDRIDQKNLPLNSLYNYNYTGAGVNAYIIDTGISTTNVDFEGRAVGGYTAVNDGNGTNDCNGHGTNVAGIVGSRTYGVAKKVNLIAVRVIDCTGYGTWSQVIAGIDWVINNHISPAVVNASVIDPKDATADAAFQNLINSGVPTVVAAGNDALDACNYSPSDLPDALTIGATDQNDARSPFSNYGRCVDLYAPGYYIISTSNGGDTGTSIYNGTSQAAPHVAGVAALYLEAHPTATPAEVSQAIISSATPNVISGIPSGANLFLYSLLGSAPSGDTTPPSSPVLSGSASNSTALLSWSASTDNIGVAGYRLYRNNNLYATFAPSVTSYSDTAVTPGGTYTYAVKAADAAGNLSSFSNSISVMIPQSPSTFKVGSTVNTVTKANLYATPNGKKSGTQNNGSVGVITSGPQSAAGSIWWYVDFKTGSDGWIVQSDLK